MYQTLITLTIAQAFAQTGAPIVVLLGGIVGALLAPSVGFATLPVALMIVGTAMTTVPAALLMEKAGRKVGFIFAASYCCVAGVVAAYAISIESFELFCFATFLVGSHNAFVQQYRFAVAESLPPEKIAQGLSVLMLAGVAAAFMGPEAAQRFQYGSVMGQFSGSFLALSGFMVGTIAALCFYKNSQPEAANLELEPRSLRTIISQPVFILAISAAVVAWSVMSLVMTATPVSMHEIDQYNLADTAWVIQSHIMAMFLPSLFSGFLVSRFGAIRIIIAGLMLLFASLLVAFVDRQLMHYWWSLVLLGVGWNFLFLGGTTLLTFSYQPAERFKIQALNDLIVFSMQATAALSSGYILFQFGWIWILGLSLPFLILLLWVLAFSRGSHPPGL